MRKWIDKGNSKWIEAFGSCDSALFSSLFDHDGALLGRNGVVLHGREDVQKGMRELMKNMGSAVVTVQTRELWVIEDLAYETGDYAYTFKPEGKQESKISGRYVTIWKEQKDHSWKIFRDIGIPDK